LYEFGFAGFETEKVARWMWVCILITALDSWNCVKLPLMNIHLRPELEELIKQDIECGSYASVDDFLEQAISMLHEQEVWLADHRDEISEQIDEGCSQARRGELLDAEQVRSLLKEKKRAVLADKQRQ